MGYAVKKQQDIIIHTTPEGLWAELADPCYLRSDTVIYTPADKSLHAVMHESLHLIGRIDAAHEVPLKAQAHIRLMAKRADGTTVNLSKPLVVSL